MLFFTITLANVGTCGGSDLLQIPLGVTATKSAALFAINTTAFTPLVGQINPGGTNLIIYASGNFPGTAGQTIYVSDVVHSN